MLVLASVVAFAVPALAQSASPDPNADLAARADRAYQDKKWEEARAAYATLVQARPQVGFYAFRLGSAELFLGRPKEAIALINKSEQLGWPKPQASFRRASAQARLGDTEAAFRELDAAIAAGFVQVTVLEAEEPLNPLHADPRWKAALDRIDRNLHPCKYDAKYREFDFWLGTWDVRPAGSPASPPSTNIITSEHDGCVIQEHWTSVVSTGQSFNIWDSSRGHWYQTWVDSTGGLHEYTGGIEDGVMVYGAELAPNPGQTGRVRTRLRFFKLGPDSVRQLAEQTPDDGKTWNTTYDLIYTRRAGTAK